LPDAARWTRTVEVTETAEKIALETPGVAHRWPFQGSRCAERHQFELRLHVIILKPFTNGAPPN